MPKVMIYENERWPEYEINYPDDSDDFTTEIELTDEELKKIEEANGLYEEAQALLRNKVEAVQEATLLKRRRGDV